MVLFCSHNRVSFFFHITEQNRPLCVIEPYIVLHPDISYNDNGHPCGYISSIYPKFGVVSPQYLPTRFTSATLWTWSLVQYIFLPVGSFTPSGKNSPLRHSEHDETGPGDLLLPVVHFPPSELSLQVFPDTKYHFLYHYHFFPYPILRWNVFTKASYHMFHFRTVMVITVFYMLPIAKYYRCD